MSFKQYLKNSLADYHKPPQPQHYPLSLKQLFVETWQLCRGQRWRFWSANYIVVVLGLVPIIAPIFAVQYPKLVFVTMMPVVPIPLAAFLTKIMPCVYFLFVDVPLYLSLFLIAARIVYQKPYQMVTSLAHYFTFFWLGNVFKVIIAFGFFLGTPLLFILSKLVLITFKDQPTAIHFLIGAMGVLVSFIGLYGFMSCLLLFIGRVPLVIGLRTVIAVVNQHIWKLWLLFMLQLAVVFFSHYTWHVLDLLLTPFMYVLWLVLYKKMFGMACHV